MAGFHELEVCSLDRVTDDAVAVTFAVPPELRETFAFRAGQHMTVRRDDVRRSYSICSTPAELQRSGVLRVGIKQIAGGAFSTFATGVLRPGDRVEVLPPLGHFTSAFDPARERHYAGIAAGSGITPVLSLITTALQVERGSRFSLLYGNRTATSVMFAEELSDLKDRYPTRLHIVHILSREQQEAELLSGRIDEARLGKIFDTLLPPADVDEWFLCGPYGMVLDAQSALSGRGVPRTAVHTELFHVEDQPVARAPRKLDVTEVDAEVTILLDGRASTFSMSRQERVLDVALRSRPELPYACKGGVCSTCRARVVEGEVEMARNFALEPEELAAGYVLTCQASPLSKTLAVDYDA
jgi:ring-1,2-phenylacetyl-CoA epoxidase subunit PaaE